MEKKDDDYVRINCWWIREICWLIKSTNNIDFYLFFFLKGCHSGHSSMFPSPCMLTLCQYENQHVRTIHTGLLLVRRDGSPCSDGSSTFSSSQVGRQHQQNSIILETIGNMVIRKFLSFALSKCAKEYYEIFYSRYFSCLCSIKTMRGFWNIRQHYEHLLS